MGNTGFSCGSTKVLKCCLVSPKDPTIQIRDDTASTSKTSFFYAKPPRQLETYNNATNYFYMKSLIIKIQAHVRGFLKRRQNRLPTLNIIESVQISPRSASSAGSLSMKIEENQQEQEQEQESKLQNVNNSSPSTIKGFYALKKTRQIYQGNGKLSGNGKLKEGFGIIKWEDGATFVSKFHNDKPIGFGKFVDKGTTFIGEYKVNAPKGYGIYTETKNGKKVSLEGEWHCSYLNGVGIEKCDGRLVYFGEFKNSQKHGIGKYIWKDGTVYEGEWKNNCMTGYGTIIFTNGTYQGQVTDGCMDGYGEFEWEDGKKYVGEYKKGVKEGFGVYLWQNEDLQGYIGFWKDGKVNGPGIKINKTQMKYGIWKNGKKETWVRCPNDFKKYVVCNEEEFENYLKYWKYLNSTDKNDIMKKFLSRT